MGFRGSCWRISAYSVARHRGSERSLAFLFSIGFDRTLSSVGNGWKLIGLSGGQLD